MQVIKLKLLIDALILEGMRSISWMSTGCWCIHMARTYSIPIANVFSNIFRISPIGAFMSIECWGLDLSELSAGVAARIPTRTNDDDRYFADTFQFMPDLGYTSMFEKILAHPSIEVCLQTDYKQLSADAAWDHVICTGPIDAYFDHRYGKLPYRSLQFQHEHLAEIDQLQQVGTVNYPNDYDYTRITEFKHLTGQHITGTSIVREFPCDEGDPYYPIPRAENEDLYKRYAELAATHDNVTFVGRLAQYRYYNMDQIAGAALKASEDIIARFK
jgi:UDP-galactopyranose mutase